MPVAPRWAASSLCKPAWLTRLSCGGTASDSALTLGPGGTLSALTAWRCGNVRATGAGG